MKNLILYTDKKENLKFKLTIEGAKIKDTFARLCLEFEDGLNLYFKGKLNEDGTCSINIPQLDTFEGNGTAKIEAVAESTYFTLHEIPFQLKKNVKVSMNEMVINDESEEEIVEEAKPKINIKLDSIVEEKVESKKEPKLETKGDNEVYTFSKFFKL